MGVGGPKLPLGAILASALVFLLVVAMIGVPLALMLF